MPKTRAVAEWILANKDWLYPTLSAVGGWLVRHLWPAPAPCPACEAQKAEQKA